MNIKSISKDFSKSTFLKKESIKVLRDISFNLEEGDIFGITGPNGAGKTTLFKIILDLIEPSSGKIDLDKRGSKYLAYINTNSRSFFWRLSARDNLIFHGKLLDLSLDMINVSIKTLSEKFGVSNILDTPFMKLSSGQMQIMIIIRALLKKPDYLIFDEATSALDNNTESAVMKSLESLGNELTLIIVAHRLTTLRNCTHVIELENGEIKQSGSYDKVIDQQVQAT